MKGTGWGWGVGGKGRRVQGAGCGVQGAGRGAQLKPTKRYDAIHASHTHRHVHTHGLTKACARHTLTRPQPSPHTRTHTQHTHAHTHAHTHTCAYTRTHFQARPHIPGHNTLNYITNVAHGGAPLQPYPPLPPPPSMARVARPRKASLGGLALPHPFTIPCPWPGGLVALPPPPSPCHALPTCLQVAGRTNDAAGDGTTTA